MHFVSGNWQVKAGKEEEFVERWLAFTDWTKETVAGARSFVLLRQLGAPQHFVSFGIWDDFASVQAWRSSSEFAELLARCRELCDEFRGTDYAFAASPDRASETSFAGATSA